MNLVIPSLLYVLAFLGVTAIVGFIYTVSIDNIYTRITGHGVNEKDNIASTVVYTIWVITAFVSPYPILKYGFEFPPPFLAQQEFAHDSQNRVSRLTDEAERIQNSLSNIDNLTIGQIQSELSNTLKFVQKLQGEAENQEKVIADLKEKTAKEKASAEEMKSIADQMSSLSLGQIEAIKYIVTEDARNESKKGFWLGVLVSFPIGFAASLASSLLMAKIRKNRVNG